MELPMHDFWESWNLRFFLLFSLLLQMFLILSAPFRKRTGNRVWLSFIWSAYLLADWVANFAVGIISNSQGNNTSTTCTAAGYTCTAAGSTCTAGSEDAGDLLAFWAPFLLLHLGGPDTLTAIALEDNELWRRHLLGVILQLFAAIYVLFQSLPTNRFWVPTVLLIVAGLIKYAERTCALYLACLETYRESRLKVPDPGPNYAKLMEAYASKREAGLPTRIEILPEPDKGTNDADKRPLDDVEVVQYAYEFFTKFRRLTVDLPFSFRERNESKNYFYDRSAKDAFSVIEVELNFIYDVLFTKAEVIHSLAGHIFRFASFTLVVVAFGLFIRINKDHFDDFDVTVTYTLFIGAISLDLVSFLMILLSDWTVVALNKRGARRINNINKFLANLSPRFSRRWSKSLGTYNLINSCVNPPRKYMGLEYVNSEPFTDELRSFIFKELLSKSNIAEISEKAKELFASRGDWTLRNYGYFDLLIWIDDVNYDESLLLWHIATELCYNYDQTPNDYRRFSKSLSDYMLYLLVMQPGMMSAVAGIGQMRFRDTCAEAKMFFSGEELKKGEEQQHACRMILNVKTEVRPIAVKGGRSKSVLFDACMLANKLKKLEVNIKWEIMSKVWVELMSYAAINCRSNTHAQQVSKGGELVTFVWLLMAHLGLGEQFHIKESPDMVFIVGK